MKKQLVSLFAASLFFAGSLVSCADDKPKESLPPEPEDVVAVYSGDKLALSVQGETSSSQEAKVEFLQMQDKSLTVKLQNVIPGVKELLLPKAKFEAVTKVEYKSEISASVTDNVNGYNVDFKGTVDEDILTARISYSEIVGDSIHTKNAGLQGKIFKGMMKIDPSDMESVEMEQRVYTSAPKDRDTSKIKIQINDFAFEGMRLGNIALDTVLVLQRGMLGEHPIYAFEIKDRKLELDIVGEVALNARGTIIDGVMNFVMDVNAIAVGLTVDVDFNGSIVTESSSTNDTRITVPANPLIPDTVVISGSTFTFKIWDSEDAAAMTFIPKIEFKAKTTLDSVVIYNSKHVKIKKIDEKTAIDFSQFAEGDYVGYHVKAEDVRTRVKKMLKMQLLKNPSLVFDMQTWVEDAGNKKPTPEGLTNSNMAGVFLPAYGIVVDMPVEQNETDNAAVITTSRTVSPTIPQTLIPGVTAGTLFLGTFKLDLFNTLKSTRFGVPYAQKPAKFKVTYKYQPGEVFYKTVVRDSIYKENLTSYHTTEVVPNEKDACSITAYVYEVDSYDDYLDGTNINSPTSKVVYKAMITDSNASNDYIEAEVDFTQPGTFAYDPTKKYKVAIVCSSSNKGDQFMGAHGSKLFVKHLEIVNK